MKAKIVNNQVTEVQEDNYATAEGELWVPVTDHNLRVDVFQKDWSGRTVGELINAMYEDIFQLKDAGMTEFVYTYDSQANTAHEILSAAPLLPHKLEELATYRYEKEIGGTNFFGVQLDTSRQSQSLIIGARLAAMANSSYVVNWKAASGWTTLDANTIIVISDAVRAHVQGCFDVEKTHSEAMTAIVDAFELMTYDFTTGWPT
jgi:Domain of unknown function (DUF4376)